MIRDEMPDVMIVILVPVVMNIGGGGLNGQPTGRTEAE
jgi:hypothetical protein